MMINGAATRKTRGFVWALEPGALRGTWCADFIRASGHRTAHKGRTYDRIPHRSRSPRLTLESKGPSTHDSALLTVFARRYCASADAQPRAIVEPRFAKHGMPTFRRRRSLNRCTGAIHAHQRIPEMPNRCSGERVQRFLTHRTPYSPTIATIATVQRFANRRGRERA